MKKALILAAGRGTRLAPLTDGIPKSLVKVNGKPIIFKQIENLYENGITDITVVSGYKANVLENEIHNTFPDVRIVESVDYASTNNMYSAYYVRELFYGEPFIMMNADVFFDSSVIKSLLNSDKENAIVVDVGNYIDESMKVIERNGYLVEISKTVSEKDALGSSIDIYKFSANGGKAFFDKCIEYIENKNELKLWSEVALNDVLNDRIELFCACKLEGKWMEIDTYEDLKTAENMFLNY